MDKIRISEIAQELGMETKEILTKAKEIELSAKAANSTVSLADAEILANYVLTGVNPKKPAPTTTKEEPTQKETVVKEEPTPSVATNETIPEETTPKIKKEVQEPEELPTNPDGADYNLKDSL